MSNEEWGKIVIIFEVDNSPYSHADNREKNIFILGEGKNRG